MVNETVLGGVALGFECSEEGLFGSENLDRTGGGLGQVGKGASL